MGLLMNSSSPSMNPNPASLHSKTAQKITKASNLQPRNWENEASKERSKPASGKTSRLSGFLWLSPSASARSLGLVFPKNIAAKCAWTLPSLSEVSWNSLIGKSMQLQKLSSIFTVALPMLANFCELCVSGLDTWCNSFTAILRNPAVQLRAVAAKTLKFAGDTATPLGISTA